MPRSSGRAVLEEELPAGDGVEVGDLLGDAVLLDLEVRRPSGPARAGPSSPSRRPRRSSPRRRRLDDRRKRPSREPASAGRLPAPAWGPRRLLRRGRDGARNEGGEHEDGDETSQMGSSCERKALLPTDIIPRPRKDIGVAERVPGVRRRRCRGPFATTTRIGVAAEIAQKLCCFVEGNSTEFGTPGRAGLEPGWENERARSEAKHATRKATCGHGRHSPSRGPRVRRLQQAQVQAGDQAGQRVPEGGPVPEPPSPPTRRPCASIRARPSSTSTSASPTWGCTSRARSTRRTSSSPRRRSTTSSSTSRPIPRTARRSSTWSRCT